MPAKPLVEYEEMFRVLQTLPIFDENGNLKKEKDCVWDEAVIKLSNEKGSIKKHNLYIVVQDNRKGIQKNLKLKHCIAVSESTSAKVTDQKAEDQDPFQVLKDLHSLVHSASLFAVIRKICSRPFSVMYSLPEQITLWSDFISNQNNVSRVFLIVINKLVDNIRIGKKVVDNILMYALATEIDNETTSLYQVISEENGKSFLIFFLREVLRNKFKMPSELIVGYLHCLLEAATTVFNECSLNEYNEYCYKCLVGTNSILPNVLIRTDVLEVLKVMDEWDCLKNQWKKKFFMCSVIYLSSLNTLDLFKKTVTDIFILCQNPLENAVTEASRLRLLNKIETLSVTKCYEQFLQYSSKENAQQIFSCMLLKDTSCEKRPRNAIFKFINDMKLEALKISSCSELQNRDHNSYCCPDLLIRIENLFLDFPVWTKLIKGHYDEVPFSLTKNTLQHLLCFNEIQEKAASDFIILHWKLLSVSCEKGRLYMNKNRTTNGKTRIGYDHSYLSCEENWKDKNIFVKKNIQNDTIVNETDKLDTSDIVDIQEKSLCIEELVNKYTEEHSAYPSERSCNLKDNNINKSVEQNLDINKTPPEMDFEKEWEKDHDTLPFYVEGNDNYSNDNSLDSKDKIDYEITHSTPVTHTMMKSVLENDEMKIQTTEKIMINDRNHFYPITDTFNDSIQNSTVVSDHDYCISSLVMDKSFKEINGIQVLQCEINYEKVKKESKGDMIEHCDAIKVQCEKKSNTQKNTKIEKSNQNKRKRKYCDAYPAAKLSYEQTCRTKKRQPTIRCETALKSINKKKYKIRNTSVFDAVMEILSFGYRNVLCCQNYCNNIVTLQPEETNLINAMVQFCSKGNFQSLYRSRALIFFKHGDKEGDNIFCSDKIGVFFSKIIENNFCLKTKLQCTNCNSISDENETKILIPSNIPFNIQNLAEYIHSHFEKINDKTCQKCLYQDNMLISQEFGPFLFIDLEDQNKEEFLHAICNTLLISKKPFELVGIIGSVFNKLLKEIQYVAYCRSIENVWYEHSDIKRHVKRLGKLPKVKMSMIIYVLYE